MNTRIESVVHISESYVRNCLAQVRAVSAEIVAGLTANAEGIERLKSQQKPLVVKLFRSVGLGGDAARKALVSLVNLSHDPAVVEMLLDLNVVNRVMEFIRDGAMPHVDLLVSRLRCRGCKCK